jgi:Protein of unknown function (DUF3105)
MPVGSSTTAFRLLASLVAAALLGACGGDAAPSPPADATPAPASTALALPASVTPGAVPAAVGEAQLPIEPGTHIPAGERGRWQHDPPSSGQHWPSPARWGLASAAYPPELWVHNLEHGGVVVLFRDAAGSPAARSFVQRAPRETRFGEQKVLDAPYPALQHAFALVAWGWLLYLDAWDDVRALEFYAAHVDQGPEDIP